MSALALVDRLRALGPERARAVLADIERDLGPAAVAALRYAPEFWLRPKQVVRPPYAAIEVFQGERGTGKSHAARELFAKLLPTTADPRIVVPTDGSVAKTVYGGPSGLKRWTPPWIRCDHIKGNGYAGDIVLGGKTITVTSAAAPVGGIGPGYGLTWADDVAAWIEAVGAEPAARAWNHVLKSNREHPGILIVATTGRGVEFLWRLLSAEERSGVRIHDLGNVENNAGNLTRTYLEKIVPGLRAANEWDEAGDPVGAFAGLLGEKARVRHVPPLAALVVSIDPAKSAQRHSCEVGIVGVGIDERGTVLGLADASRVMSSSEWPAVAWDLFTKLRRDHPAADARFVVEDNVGDEPVALLRAEEKLRNVKRGRPSVSTTEIRKVTARKNEGKARRASRVVALAKGGQLRMAEDLGVLEAQLENLRDGVPGQDRADAFVHGARDLAGCDTEDEFVAPPEDVERDTDWGEESRYASVAYEDRGYR